VPGERGLAVRTCVPGRLDDPLVSVTQDDILSAKGTPNFIGREHFHVSCLDLSDLGRLSNPHQPLSQHQMLPSRLSLNNSRL
jgi:hypothetical protein